MAWEGEGYRKYRYKQKTFSNAVYENVRSRNIYRCIKFEMLLCQQRRTLRKNT